MLSGFKYLTGGISMDFSIRLENLVEEKNITQKQLSAELNIAAPTLNGYINNRREPDFRTLVRLARYFDVTSDYLLGLSDERKPAPSTLNPAEGRLIHVYRSLMSEYQDLLLELAKFLQNFPKRNHSSGK